LEGKKEVVPAGSRPVARGPERLAAVLDEEETVLRCDLEQGLDVRALPVEADRDDAARLLRQHLLDLPGVDVVSQRLDVDEDRRGASERDHLGCRDEGEGRRDDLVPGTHPVRHQREQESIGSGGAAEGVPDSHVRGQTALQFGPLGSQDELGTAEHLVHSGADVGLISRELALQIDEFHWIIRLFRDANCFPGTFPCTI